MKSTESLCYVDFGRNHSKLRSFIRFDSLKLLMSFRDQDYVSDSNVAFSTCKTQHNVHCFEYEDVYMVPRGHRKGTVDKQIYLSILNILGVIAMF